MKKALLIVSFGTSVPSARESITAVENTLKQEDMVFARAFTSPTIRRILQKRGEEIRSVTEAMEELLSQGITDVVVQPTHILCGIEYDKIQKEVSAFQGKFQSILLGKPLLITRQDIHYFAEQLSLRYPVQEKEALVLFGHGTDHFANVVYPALQTEFTLMGRRDVIVGTVEGWPDLSDVEKQLKGHFEGAHLVPMMLVAGDHAMNDMAGEAEDSWKSILEADGYTVRCTMTGLGLEAFVQDLYKKHLAEVLA